MRLEIFILGLTAFFVYNAYTDGKYTKMFMSFKKYYKMIFYALLGIGIYYMLKRNPNRGKDMLLYANNVVKYLPIDKNSMDMLSPIIDFTGTGDRSFMEQFNDIETPQTPGFYSEKRMLSSGKGGTKRSVSETKKKYVAANQEWKCGHCQHQLDHTFEIDHRIRLEYGGGNDVDNLIALCRNCHGKKTASENM
jgi:HNH endonuclease